MICPRKLPGQGPSCPEFQKKSDDPEGSILKTEHRLFIEKVKFGDALGGQVKIINDLILILLK